MFTTNKRLLSCKEALNRGSEFKILWDTFRSQIAELWFPHDRTITIHRRRSQKIEDGSIFCGHLRSSAITIAGSQTIAEVCFHMIADDRKTFYDLRSAITIVCDHMETSLKTPPEVNFQARCTLCMPKPSFY